MPNHVTTRCIVKGSNKDISEFKHDFYSTQSSRTGELFDFDNIIKQPQEVLDSIANAEPGMDPLWYVWQKQHWGVKWGSYNVTPLEEDSNDVLEFCFDTAWSFPFPIFKELENLFPNLTFLCYCYDEGGFFAGRGTFGKETDEEAPFELIEATDDLYEIVYGEPMPSYED